MSKEVGEEKLSKLVGMPLREIREEFISVAEMQRHIMPDPKRARSFGDFDIFGKTLPINVVGGDFYDFIDLGERFGLHGRLGIVIADASGHGLSAAMLIRDFYTALYTGISFESHYAGDTTPLLFFKINRRMFRSSQPNQFISAVYGELHSDGKLRYINAGHYSPLLFKKDGVVLLDVGGPLLGAFRDTPVPYQVGEVHMDSQDILVCYTDGVVEAVNASGEEYGESRLRKVVEANRDRSAQEVFNALVYDLEEFTGPVGQSDDRTILVIKRDRFSDPVEQASLGRRSDGKLDG